jgi:hypothetical protein
MIGRTVNPEITSPNVAKAKNRPNAIFEICWGKHNLAIALLLDYNYFESVDGIIIILINIAKNIPD